MNKVTTFYARFLFIITAILSIFITESVNAQWTWLNPLPQGNKLNKVCFTDSNIGTAVGSVGTIMRTTDGGTTWTIQQSGLTIALLDVSFIDANTGTVVGGSGNILRTTDGGETWISQNSGITTTLRGVSFTDANNGTAVGAQGKILRTTNGGATWSQQTSGTTSFLYSVSFVDSATGTAVGAAGTIRRTTNGGATWSAQTSGTTGILWSVCFVDNNHGTTVGDNQTIRHTTDGGVTWTTQVSQGGGIGALYGVSFADTSNGWIVGSQFGETIQHTTDGGATWTSQFFSIYPSLWGVSSTSQNTAVAVGYVGAIMSTTDGGVTWKNQVHGTQNVLGPVVFPTANIGYVGGTYGLIQKTTDAGQTWIDQTSGITNSMFYGMYFVNENVGTAVSAGGDIVRTTNGGSSWSVQSSGTTDFLYGVAFTDVNHGFVSGGGTFLNTTDGGTTWTFQSGGLSSYAGISFGNSLNGTVVGSGIIHTTDGGTTWVPQSGGTSNYLWGVHFIDANTGTAVGDAGTIIHTTNGGTTWITQTSGTTNDLWGVRFADADNGTAVGDLGVILQTTNGGLNWMVEQSPTGNFLNGVTYPTPSTCIVVGEGGAILSKRTAAAPQPPSNLSAVANTFFIDLTWQDNADNELGFKIERKDDSLHLPTPWVLIDSVGANVTTYNNTGLTPNTTYSYRLYAYNMYGESPSDSIESTTLPSTPTTFQLTVNIANGWNMVSIPGLNTPDQNVNTWWAFRDLGANVFRYEGGYQSVTDAVPGIGYWMKHSGDRTYNTGDEWPAGGIQIVAHNPIAAESGWNLFGGYELSVTAANITTNPPGLQNGPIYRYSGGYAVATTIEPGYGYWMKLDAAGQIIIPETMAKGEAVEYFPENWGKIILTDATGINYTLYAVKGEVDLNQYDLPPAPPTGMFDIRFSSGRIAEDINSAIKTIDLNGVTYPLTVRVEGMDIRLMDETGKTINANLKKGEDIIISDATIQKLMVTGELIPAEYALEQNYPNPFNPSTVIEFSLPENVGNVQLSIYNMLGEKVAELVNTALTAGKYQYQWNARDVATGMYIYELRTEKFVSVKKMLLLK